MRLTIPYKRHDNGLLIPIIETLVYTYLVGIIQGEISRYICTCFCITQVRSRGHWVSLESHRRSSTSRPSTTAVRLEIDSNNINKTIEGQPTTLWMSNAINKINKANGPPPGQQSQQDHPRINQSQQGQQNQHDKKITERVPGDPYGVRFRTWLSYICIYFEVRIYVYA